MIRTRSSKPVVARQPSRSTALRGIAAQLIDLGRSEVALVDTDVRLPVEVDQAEGDLAQLADGMHLAGRDDEVVGLGLLEHQPHRLDVLRRVAPVSLGVEIAEVQMIRAFQQGWPRCRV